MSKSRTEKTAELKSLKDGYTIVPNALLSNELLSAGAKLVYITLLKYARNKEKCSPGIECIAQDIRMSRRYIHSCIQELRKEKLIIIRRRGLGKSNVYSLCLQVRVKLRETKDQDLSDPLKRLIEESGIFSIEE